MDAMREAVLKWLLLFVVVAIRAGDADDGETEMKQCSGQHVCTTLMRYPDGYVADEGPNCKCRPDQLPCTPEAWEEENLDHVLTWQHYERSHWTVQYKFCTPVFARTRECDIENKELAAVITTDVTLWQPDLTEPRCHCPPGALFQLMGWKRERNVWKYYYECYKPECAVGLVPPRPQDKGRLPCAKIYLDPYESTEKVKEVQFLCACPEGQMCPGKLSKKQEDADYDVESDAQGRFVMKYCDNTKVSRTN